MYLDEGLALGTTIFVHGELRATATADSVNRPGAPPAPRINLCFAS